MEGGSQPAEQIPKSEGEPAEPWQDQLEQQPEPRIYVADLAAYNAGVLRGVWLDAGQEPEELHDQIAGMLAQSPELHAEEWAIHDFEGFNGLRLGEWESLDHVSKLAKGITEHGLAYAHWAAMVSDDEELEQFEECYLGRWTDRTEYAADVLDDLGLSEQIEQAVPENLRPYVTLDAEGFGRDLELGGDITVTEGDGGVYIFANR
jgi:antirestriction protein